MKIEPEDSCILLSEAIYNPDYNTNKLIEYMFEKFNFGKLYIALSPILTLFADGKHDGFVIDIGEGITQMAPIIDAEFIPFKADRMDIGGSDATEYMKNLLHNSGIFFSTKVDKYVYKDIKEKSCFISLDFENEKKSIESYIYELSDKTKVEIKSQRFECPEIFFKPNLIGKDEEQGIVKKSYDIIEKCNEHRCELYNNIVISGCSTNFSNFTERFVKEIQNIVSDEFKKDINTLNYNSSLRGEAVWIGGCVFASLSIFNSLAVSKSEYDENGLNIVLRRFLRY